MNGTKLLITGVAAFLIGVPAGLLSLLSVSLLVGLIFF